MRCKLHKHPESAPLTPLMKQKQLSFDSGVVEKSLISHLANYSHVQNVHQLHMQISGCRCKQLPHLFCKIQQNF